jgi:NAD(P)H-hydrate epimerase
VNPVVTSAEMADADRAALEVTTLEALVGRAGGAVAAAALAMLGGAYGRRIVVVAGKGNNGADGRVAARALEHRGAQVIVFEASAAPSVLPGCDLVVDAAYGTGFRGEYVAPVAPDGALVLAVDIPSGVDANLGTASSGAVRADATVTFQALKPGLVLGEGPARCGRVTVADIGIGLGDVAIFQVCDDDLASIPERTRDSHKWKTAVFICAGSPGLYGAPLLAARAAMRAGAGMVRLGVPGGVVARQVPLELVEIAIAEQGFAKAVLVESARCRALVLGPGLGRGDAVSGEVAEILARSELPVVLDADGIVALGDLDTAARLLRARPAPTVLTPHDGEYARLVGRPPGDDRIAAARRLADTTGAIVLLKGSTTVVADPTGVAVLSTAGSPRLATAGTGDVLSGVIGAFVARGMSVRDAASIGAHVHGRAAARGRRDGLVAGDLPDLVADVLSAAPR